MVKALDCRSGEDVRAGSIPSADSFFLLNDDGGAWCSGAKRER